MDTIPTNTHVMVKIGSEEVPAVVVGYAKTGALRVRFSTGKEALVKGQARVIRQPSRDGLLGAAVRLLEASGEPRTAGELIKKILAHDLWRPTRQGKTPRLTLYAMLYSESKKPLSRVRRLEGGLWVWNTLKHKNTITE